MEDHEKKIEATRESQQRCNILDDAMSKLDTCLRTARAQSKLSTSTQKDRLRWLDLINTLHDTRDLLDELWKKEAEEYLFRENQ